MSALDEYLNYVEKYFDENGGQLAGIVDAKAELTALRAKLAAADELAIEAGKLMGVVPAQYYTNVIHIGEAIYNYRMAGKK